MSSNHQCRENASGPRKSASRFGAARTSWPTVRRLPSPSRPFRSFSSTPKFDQRAVDREVIRAGQPLHPWLRRTALEQLGGDVAFQQPIAVLGKCRVIPPASSTPMPTNQRNQKIELQPLHQLPLRADRVEHLQEHRPQQLLRRNRGATDPRIERRKLARKRRQGRSLPHRQWFSRMILANPRFEIDVTEQRP